MRGAVTGANGKVGRAVVAELLQHPHYSVVAVVHRSLSQELANLVARPHFRPRAETDVVLKRADLTDYGQAACDLDGADAVIHLAAIPDPRTDPPHVVYGTNETRAARLLVGHRLLQGPTVLRLGARAYLEARPRGVRKVNDTSSKEGMCNHG